MSADVQPEGRLFCGRAPRDVAERLLEVTPADGRPVPVPREALTGLLDIIDKLENDVDAAYADGAYGHDGA